VQAVEATRRQRTPYSGVLHTILGVLLAVLVVVWTGHVMTSWTWFMGLTALFLLSSATVAAAAGFRQRHGTLPRELRVLTWWTFWWLCTVVAVATWLSARILLWDIGADGTLGPSVVALVVTAGFLGLWVAFELRRRRTRS
jgi:ATP/ADP translocase